MVIHHHVQGRVLRAEMSDFAWCPNLRALATALELIGLQHGVQRVEFKDTSMWRIFHAKDSPFHEIVLPHLLVSSLLNNLNWPQSSPVLGFSYEKDFLSFSQQLQSRKWRQACQTILKLSHQEFPK